jgi:hhH-GPD family protein
MDYGAVHLTARKTKIKSLGKQSKFEGSDRQVRGRILKQLTKGEIKSLTFDCVCAEFPQKDVDQIVAGMVKDGLVTVQEKTIVIE